VALDRDLFLASVTGYADSYEAAVEVAERFLQSTGAPGESG
jgi:hypothetical protein